MSFEVVLKTMKQILIQDIKIPEHRYHILAATLDSKDRFIAFGKNSYTKTHPLQQKYAFHSNPFRKYLHAEIAALVKSQTKVQSIIIMRMNKSGYIRMAKPCPICMLALQEARVKNIYYTDADGFLQKEEL